MSNLKTIQDHKEGKCGEKKRDLKTEPQISPSFCIRRVKKEPAKETATCLFFAEYKLKGQDQCLASCLAYKR